MMIHAYQEFYLNSAQKRVGDAFDYAINDCQIKGNDFVKMFLVGNISHKIENGEPLYLKGKSGIEIAREIIEEATNKIIEIEPKIRYERTKEYWIGYVITYYQWYTNLKFGEIFNIATYEELENMYYTLHEADISKFVDIMEEKKKNDNTTKLKKIRTICGLSQSELSKLSNVSLRSIQMYEQRKKDINKASLQTIYMLSKALGCKVEDLIEK